MSEVTQFGPFELVRRLGELAVALRAGVPPAHIHLHGNAKPRVAFLIIHRTSNFLQHLGCTELSKRGYVALCMNTRYENNELLVDWDRIALDVKAGVEFLRKQPGIERVLFLAHSGGGPTLSFYQAVAENGLAFCQNPNKIAPCKSDLAGLPRVDGIAFTDAHPGVPVILLRSLNGSVLNETPKNGADNKLVCFLHPKSTNGVLIELCQEKK